jgi:hypothetical protein
VLQVDIFTLERYFPRQLMRHFLVVQVEEQGIAHAASNACTVSLHCLHSVASMIAKPASNCGCCIHDCLVQTSK